MENKNINYIQILKDAWKTTWNNKFLWWFGFFIAIGGGGMSSFNFSGNEDSDDISSETIESVNYYWSMYKEWIILGIVIVSLIMFTFYILNIIGRGGLISSLIKINNNEKTNFSTGFKEGMGFFWKLFILNLIFGIIILLSLAILIFPIARLVYLEAYGASVILGLIALPIIISIFILAAFLKIYSQIYIVGNKISVTESIKLAYSVFKKNIKKSILMGILLMVVGIIIGIGLVLIIIILAIPIVIVGVLINFLAGTAVAVGAGILVLLILFIFSMVWQSVYMVFMQSVWLLFFNKIAKIDKEIDNKLEEKIKEEIPELGKA